MQRFFIVFALFFSFFNNIAYSFYVAKDQYIDQANIDDTKEAGAKLSTTLKALALRLKNGGCVRIDLPVLKEDLDLAFEVTFYGTAHNPRDGIIFETFSEETRVFEKKALMPRGDKPFPQVEKVTINLKKDHRFIRIYGVGHEPEIRCDVKLVKNEIRLARAKFSFIKNINVYAHKVAVLEDFPTNKDFTPIYANVLAKAPHMYPDFFAMLAFIKKNPFFNCERVDHILRAVGNNCEFFLTHWQKLFITYKNICWVAEPLRSRVHHFLGIDQFEKSLRGLRTVDADIESVFVQNPCLEDFFRHYGHLRRQFKIFASFREILDDQFQMVKLLEHYPDLKTLFENHHEIENLFRDVLAKQRVMMIFDDVLSAIEQQLMKEDGSPFKELAALDYIYKVLEVARSPYVKLLIAEVFMDEELLPEDTALGNKLQYIENVADYLGFNNTSEIEAKFSYYRYALQGYADIDAIFKALEALHREHTSEEARIVFNMLAMGLFKDDEQDVANPKQALEAFELGEDDEIEIYMLRKGKGLYTLLKREQEEGLEGLSSREVHRLACFKHKLRKEPDYLTDDDKDKMYQHLVNLRDDFSEYVEGLEN